MPEPTLQHHVLTNFSRGMALKPDLLGGIVPIRQEGFKYKKFGGLGYRGALTEYPITNPTAFSGVNGVKKWYRNDGTSSLFLMGSGGLYLVSMPDGNLGSPIQSIADSEFDIEAPALWVNCDNQLILLLDGMNDRPYSVKLSGAGINLSRLGLVAPSERVSIVAFELGQGIDGVDTPVVGPGVIGTATYKWAFSYSYGTADAPGLYGESALGPSVSYTLVDTSAFAGNVGWRITLSGLNPMNAFTNLITRINVYRTLANGNSFFKVGEVTNRAATTYIDTVKSSFVDTSKTPALLTGLPSAMRVARWYNGRLWWFGTNGRLHASAAGFPDITPTNYFVDPGNIGYRGNWIGILRDNIFVGKEDGIYLIQGSVPNLISRRIDSTRCFCRSSFVEMPDGIYFLGEQDGSVGVYRFDGNQALPVAEVMRPLFFGHRELLYKKAFARRVGEEYWLAFPCQIVGHDITESHYVFSNVPFNNLVLQYNYKTGASQTFQIQASSIDTFDGFGDNDEVYITESDNAKTLTFTCNTTNTSPVITTTGGAFANVLIGATITGAGIPANTVVSSIDSNIYNSLTMSKNATATAGVSVTFTVENKGKLYRVDPYAKTVALSYMFNGARYHNKVYPYHFSKLAFGPIVSKKNPFTPVRLGPVIISIRRSGYAGGRLKYFGSGMSSDASLETVDSEVVGMPVAPDSSRLGYIAALLGTLVLQPMLLIRQEFNFADTVSQLGNIIEYSIDPAASDLDLDYEIEGIDIVYDEG